MIWILLFVNLLWANDPLNNGIVIENISIDAPTIEPPSVDISDSQGKGNYAPEKKPEVQGQDSHSATSTNDKKDASPADKKKSDPDSGSAYLQPKVDRDDEKNDDDAPNKGEKPGDEAQ